MDWLHVLSLGVFQTFCSFTMHHLFLVDAWQTGETTAPAKLVVTMSRLAAEVSEWKDDATAGRYTSC